VGFYNLTFYPPEIGYTPFTGAATDVVGNGCTNLVE
jgi:hypothetical protein